MSVLGHSHMQKEPPSWFRGGPEGGEWSEVDGGLLRCV